MHFCALRFTVNRDDVGKHDAILKFIICVIVL